MKTILLSFIFVFFIGCSDDGDVYVTDQKILTTHIECMKLVVFPPDKEIESTLQSLYNFQDNCAYEFVISYKTGIVCNSNQNFDKKISGMPSSYLRMEIKRKNKLLYTYYKDLKEKLSQNDIKNGFAIIQDDLDF